MKRLSYNTSCAAVGAIVIGALIAVWQGGEIKAAASSSLEPERVAVTYVTSINKSQPVAEAAERMQEAKEMKTIPEWPAFAYERDWTEEETYLLARLAMAEAEGCSIQCKTLIIMSVLNRVESDLFPGNIHDVIYQCTGGTYQTSYGKSSSNCTELVPYYPANNGAVPGTEKKIYLMAGDKIDRFGGKKGKFFSPTGTPMEMRALPYDADLSQYRQFEVVKPFEVEASTIAPAFGNIGLGTQYRSSVSVDVLLKKGIIKQVGGN